MGKLQKLPEGSEFKYVFRGGFSNTNPDDMKQIAGLLLKTSKPVEQIEKEPEVEDIENKVDDVLVLAEIKLPNSKWKRKKIKEWILAHSDYEVKGLKNKELLELAKTIEVK